MDKNNKPGNYSQSSANRNHISRFNESHVSATDEQNFDLNPQPPSFTSQTNGRYCSENKHPLNEMQQRNFRQPENYSFKQIEKLYNMRHSKDSLESRNSIDMHDTQNSSKLYDHDRISREQNERSYFDPKEVYFQDHKYCNNRPDLQKESDMSWNRFSDGRRYCDQEPSMKQNIRTANCYSDKRNFGLGNAYEYDITQQVLFRSQQSNAIKVSSTPLPNCNISQNYQEKSSNINFSRSPIDNNQDLSKCQTDRLDHNDGKFNKISEEKSNNVLAVHSAESILSDKNNLPPRFFLGDEKRKSYPRVEPPDFPLKAGPYKQNLKSRKTHKKILILDESTEVKSQILITKLPKGCSEVKVIYLKNPSQLYIHLLDNISEIKKFQTKLQNIYKDSVYQDEFHFQNGDFCAALFTDQIWYRGKVLSSDLEERIIYFIDYGNFDTVSVKNLRPLKSDFYEYPAQAIQVSLANIQPKSDSWDLQATGFLHGCTFHIKMIMDVVEDGDIPKILLINPNENVIINNLMVELDYAIKQEKNIEQQQITELRKIKADDHLTVSISYVDNPSAFWMWNADIKTKEALTKLENLQDSFCGKSFPSNCVPSVGDIVATKFSDESWYRVKVESVLKDRCNIFYIDYGNQDCVSFDALLPLNPSLTEFPPLAMYCKLNRIRSIIEGFWEEAAVEYFKKLVINKKLEAIVISVQNKHFTVELKNHSDQFISDLLIDLEYGVKDELPSPQKILSPIKGESSSKIKSSPKKNLDRLMFDKLQSVTLTCGQKFTATFLHFQSFQEVYIQVASKTTLSCLNDLHSCLSTFCNNLSCKNYMPVVGEVVCAVLDNVWYRVRADEILENQIKVFFCDYGYSKHLSKTQFQEIGSELCKLPFQAIKCRLTDVSIKEISATGPFMEKIMLLVNKPCTVEVLSTDSNSYLINTIDSNGFLLDKMLDVSHSKTNNSPSISVSKTVFSSEKNKIYFVDDVESVKLNVGEIYFFAVQCVLSPNLIFCNANQEKIEEFNQFMINMTEYYTQVPFDANYKPGQEEICAAQFSEDQAWYRASILTCDEDDTVKVFYIDFGNIEVKSLSCVRKLHSQFLKFPSQAIHCKLAGIVPVNGEDWPLQVTEKLIQLMPIYSILTAQVKSQNVDHYTIDVMQVDDKLVPVNQMLVNLKLAKKIL